MSKQKPTREAFIAHWIPKLCELFGEAETLAKLLELEAQVSARLGRLAGQFCRGDAGHLSDDECERLGTTLLHDPEIIRLRAEADALLLRIGRMTLMHHALSEMYDALYGKQPAPTIL